MLGACNDTAVVWRNGQPNTLGRLAGGTYSVATAINSYGVVIGEGDNGNGRPQAWVRTNNGLYNFFPNNGGNTHALFIADNGVIGGYYTKSLSGNTSSWRGAFWTPDPKDPRRYRLTDLPVLPGAIDSKSSAAIAIAFNRQGQAAGYAMNDVIGEHAVLWNSDSAHSIVDLGVYPGDWSSFAWAMNDLGHVVGDSYPPGSSRAVVWDNDAAHTPIELPLLAGDDYATARAVNNLGHVLGSSTHLIPGTWTADGPQHSVLWRDGGVYELSSLVDPVVNAGWTITSAVAINNLGQILGFGFHNGEGRVVVLTPQQ